MYYFSTTFNGTFDEAIESVTEALKTEGFGVLTEIDVQATLKAKLDIDRRPYRILGACNPHYAHQAIDAEPHIGLLLPCNVVVQETEDGSIEVSFMDPAAVLDLVGRDEIVEVAQQVRARLQRVCDAL